LVISQSLSTTAKRRTLITLTVVSVLGLLPYLTINGYHIDLDVYRIGAQVLLAGGDLYGHLPATEVGLSLGFTYPPFAALLFAPFTLMPLALAGVLLTVLTVAMLAVAMAPVLTSLGIRYDRRWLCLLMPVALLIEPIRSTLGYGQINVLLMALVAVDCLAAKSRLPRGVLIGVAAAIKLTPAVFILFFLFKKDYRAAVTTVGSFAAATAIGFAVSWHNSVRYWTSTVFDTDRIGGSAYTSNQSIQGFLARLGLAHTTVPWALASAVVLVLAAIAMRRAFAVSSPTWALAFNAFAGLLVSPVSWSHHWVWALPAIVAFAVIGRRAGARTPMVLAGTGLVLFAVAPHWLLPQADDKELHWALWQQLLGNSYIYYAAAVLAIAALSKSMWAEARK
jgi:alpha-1,2-mannosyltransferase